ncbi:MAG: tyrosine-type recombinase/integrase [Treponema sp.]|nr:tyrosine-type recombinase/integrase [Treponema sp.]
MADLQYHVFKKPKKLKNGKTVKRWYYYYVDQNGKQVQKSCGKSAKSRQQAEDFIRTLPPPQSIAVSLTDRTMPPKNPDMLIGEITRDMFIPGSLHVHRRQQLKKSTTEDTLTAGRVFMRYITETWGQRMIRSIELDEIMNYLFSLKRSASWKNQYISALKEIYQEAQFSGCKIFKPDFPSIGKTINKADIFTRRELELFFQRNNFSHDFFFLFFLCSLSGGLRLGETRGMRGKQIIFEKKAVVIDGYLKHNGTRTTYNKKGSPEHPKLRVVLYPDFTLGLLQAHIATNNIGADDFVFSYNGHPIGQSMAQTAFNLVLIKSGIAPNKEALVKSGKWKKGHLNTTRGLIPDNRRLIHHSLRYTYVTHMSEYIDAHNLKKFTGHDSTSMIDYYNRRNLDIALASIPAAEDATSSLLPFAIDKTV